MMTLWQAGWLHLQAQNTQPGGKLQGAMQIPIDLQVWCRYTPGMQQMETLSITAHLHSRPVNQGISVPCRTGHLPEYPVETGRVGEFEATPPYPGTQHRPRPGSGKFTQAGTPIRLTWARDGDEVVLRVADEGPGIPKGERRRVFERYARGAQARADGVPGTGLGLSLGKELVEGLGGSVALGPSEVGAAFALRLPGVNA